MMFLIDPFSVKQSWRLLQHEIRRGELTIIFMAILLAVATVFSLSGFSYQIKQALISQSSSFIAADRVLASSRPIDQNIIRQSKLQHLKTAKQILMSTMLFAPTKSLSAAPASVTNNAPANTMILVSLKAVSTQYPLRGKLFIKTKTNENKIANSPLKGQVWVEKKVLTALNLQLGDRIDIGFSLFKITAVIKKIPDVGLNFFSIGPTVILNINDMPATKLIQPGSRVWYKYLFAGNENDVEKFSTWIKPQVNETQRWYGIQSRQTRLARTLSRAEKYLSLASMLGIVLAALAVSVAARRYKQRQQPNVAVFKAIGVSKQQIQSIYLLHWSLLSLVSIVAGILVGFVIQEIGLSAMTRYLAIAGSISLFYPLMIAVITGLICAIAFAFVPLIQLVNTSAIEVIRPLSVDKSIFFNWQYLPAFVALFALLMLFSQDWQLSLALLFGGLVIVVVLMVFAYFVLQIGRRVGSRVGQALQLAWANLTRNATENSVQLVSFTLAIQLLLLLMVVRYDLINEWQAQLPKNTPNRFMVNISKPQMAAVKQFVTLEQLQSSSLYAVVPGRLAAINQEKIIKNPQNNDNNKQAIAKGRQGIGREINLTWRVTLPKTNKIVQGNWWQAHSTNAQVSVEQTFAKRLKIKLGDQLTMQLGSQHFNAKVTSIRKVNWQSMQPNFYLIFNEKVLQNFPATYITALYLPKNKVEVLSQFLAKYPTISLLNIEALISQLKTVIDKVSIAVEFILIFVVLSGSLVLVAQVQATMETRQRDLAILRTLGAKGSLLRNSVLFEFVALGSIAGLLGSAIMEITVYFLQSQVFNMSAHFHWRFWLLGVGAGGFFVGGIGLLSCWRLLTKRALHRYVV